MERAALARGITLAAALLFLAATVIRAATQPFWYDELFTVHVVDISDPARIWKALTAGVDLNPPLLYAATWAGRALAGNNEVGNRLPAILGYLLFLYATGAFLARRAGPWAGLLAASLLALSEAYTYALQARSYGMLLGWSSLALLCWQSSADSPPGISRLRPLAGLSLATAAALLTHCYALVALFPIAAGEAMRTLRRRRVDLPLAASLAVAAPAILIYFPLLASSRGYQLQGPLFDPSARKLINTYAGLAAPLLWPTLLVFALAMLARLRRANQPALAPGVPVHESAALAALMLTPAIAYLLAVGAKGGYFTRYALGASAAMSIAAALGASRMVRRAQPALMALSLLTIGWFAVRFLHRPAVFPVASEAAALASADPSLPIVVSDGQTFLELNYYADPATAARLVFLTDRPAALRHMRTDCYDRIMPILTRWFPIHGRVIPAADFLSRRQRFLIYGTREREHTWLPQRLEALHVPVAPAWNSPRRTLAEVHWPPGPSRNAGAP
ncbi:MAG: hypothetical protein R2762_11905 [Bryobacteraceae bacterium]